jgi:hypothetical protein
MAALCAVGIVTGALSWWLSPRLTGYAEPWDAPGYFYLVRMVISGFVTGLAYPRCFWVAPLAVGLGQTIFMYATHSPTDPMIFPPCFCVTILGVLPSLFGVLLAFCSWMIVTTASK